MIKVKKIFKRILFFFKKHFWIILTMILMIISICLICISYLFENNDAQSVLQNFGLGLIASSLVSMFIEIKNYYQNFSKKNELKKGILYELKEETLNLYFKCFKILEKFADAYNYEMPTKNIFSSKNVLKYKLIYEKMKLQIDMFSSLNKEECNNFDSRLKFSKYDIEPLYEILTKINYLYYTSNIDYEIYHNLEIAYKKAVKTNKYWYNNKVNIKQKYQNFVSMVLLCSSSIAALININFLNEEEIREIEIMK